MLSGCLQSLLWPRQEGAEPLKAGETEADLEMMSEWQEGGTGYRDRSPAKAARCEIARDGRAGLSTYRLLRR